jgi:putative SOS response-associated peptidase YedK
MGYLLSHVERLRDRDADGRLARMCGRYAASRSPEDLAEEFEVERVDDEAAAPAAPAGEPDWNVAPTKTAPVVLERPPREDREAEPVRQLRRLTWGLVPSWAKDRSVGSRMINARAESLLDKPAYRRAATARRCLVPADGWYEWQASPVAKDAKGRPRKQPFFVHRTDGGVIAFAGVYELWRDSTRDADDPAAWLATYAVVTTDAETGMDRIHDRMPLVLPRERWDAWLDPAVTEPDDVRALLAPAAPGRFVAEPVSARVNDVRNNGPELVTPLPVEELVGVIDPATGEVLGGQDAALF